MSRDRRWIQSGPNAAQTPEGVVVAIKKGSIDQEKVNDMSFK